MSTTLHDFCKRTAPLNPIDIPEPAEPSDDAIWDQQISKLSADVKHEVKRESRFLVRQRYRSRLLSVLTLAVAVTQGSASVMTAESPIVQLQEELVTCQGILESHRAVNGTEIYLSSSHEAKLDSDSYLIAIDNCSSRCMTNSLSDFITPPKRTNIKVRGIWGSVTASHVGTALWKVEDDHSKVHAWLIPNTVCNPQIPFRLLSPQHWAQEHEVSGSRTLGSSSFSDAVELFWDKTDFFRSIPLDPSSNITLMRSANEFKAFSAFCTTIAGKAGVLGEEELLSMAGAVVSDVEDSDIEDEDDIEDAPRVLGRCHPDTPDAVFDKTMQSSEFCHPVSYDVQQRQDDTPHVTPEDVETQCTTPQAELLVWHCRLGHISFERILRLAARGHLPARLLKCKIPRCASCACGKVTKRPWRTKAPPNKFSLPPADSPGAVVSVDQSVSSTPGLIGQMKGFLTTKRYTVTTVFVDSFSGLSFVHSQQSASAESRRLKRRGLSNALHSHTGWPSITVMQTMAHSRAKPSWQAFTIAVRQSRSALSMHTTKMASQRRKSETSKKQHDP